MAEEKRSIVQFRIENPESESGMFATATYSDGHWENQYQCPGHSYWLKEDECQVRQDRKFRSCHSCVVKCGGSADPRPLLKK